MLTLESDRSDASSLLDQLKSLLGLPARIWMEEPSVPAQIIKLPGMVQRVFPAGLAMELLFPMTHPRSEVPVILEIMSRSALYQFRTVIQGSDSPQRIHLRLPTEMHVIQRRRSPRVTVSMEALVTKADEETLVGQVMNISANGAAIMMAEAIPVGTVIRVALQVPGDAEIDLQARVVRCTLSPNGACITGVSFLNLTGKQEEWLHQYVSRFAEVG